MKLKNNESVELALRGALIAREALEYTHCDSIEKAKALIIDISERIKGLSEKIKEFDAKNIY